MDKDSKGMSGTEFVIVVLLGTTLAVFIIIGLSMIAALVDLNEATDDFKDDMGEDIVPDDWEIVPTTASPGYEYSISNVQMNLTLTFEFNGTVVGVMSIYYECELYSISCLLNDDGEYDLVIDIVGLNLNASIVTDGNISGGSLTIDEFHYSGVVNDCTEDAIREALLEVGQVEQWSQEL